MTGQILRLTILPLMSVCSGLRESCTRCGAGERSASMTKPLCRDSLAALRHVLYGEEKRLYAFRLDGAARKRFAQAAEAFLFAQLERKFKTLDFYKSLNGESA